MTPAATTPAPAPQRLLVATDFSALGNSAVPLALSLAQPGAVVRIVHVVHRLALPHGEFARSIYQPLFDLQHSQVLAQTAEKLHALVPADTAARGITVETAPVEADDPADGVCAESERFGATIICLGSHGTTGLMSTLLGSVAQGILRLARTPVLLARAPA